jgi:hypothetical protein
MAALAVFLLVAAAVAGFNAPSSDGIGDAATMAGTSNEAPAQSVRSVNAKKGLKFNFYLFRHK